MSEIQHKPLTGDKSVSATLSGAQIREAFLKFFAENILCVIII